MSDNSMAPETWRSSTWCTVFGSNCGCWHVDWGQEGGPDLDFNTVKALSRQYMRKNKSRLGLIVDHIYVFPESYANRSYLAWVKMDKL